MKPLFAKRVPWLFVFGAIRATAFVLAKYFSREMNVTAADIEPTLAKADPRRTPLLTRVKRENATMSSGPVNEMPAYKCSRLGADWAAKVALKRYGIGFKPENAVRR